MGFLKMYVTVKDTEVEGMCGRTNFTSPKAMELKMIESSFREEECYFSRKYFA